jgi:hypothetical protein
MNMTYSRTITVTLALFATLAVTARSEAGAPGKPNILFILADDMGYGDLSCYGAVSAP